MESIIPAALRRLGEAAGVSRVCVFRADRVGRHAVALLRHEWTAPGVRSRIGERGVNHVPLGELGLDQWEQVLPAGGIIAEPIGAPANPNGELFGASGVRAIAVAPIFVEQDWWGFLGFDDCTSERAWNPEEMASLHLAADLLGSLFSRQEMGDRYRALAGSVAEGIAILQGGRVIDANTGLLRMLGRPAAAVIGHRSSEFVSREGPVVARRDGWTDRGESGGRWLLHADGTSRPVRLTRKRVRHHGRTAWMVTVDDLAARETAVESGSAAFERTKDAERRAEFLAEASRILNSSFDYQTTLGRFARLAVPFLGDYCVIDIMDGERIRRVATAHQAPEGEALARGLEQYPPTWIDNPVVEVYRTGRTVLAGPDELRPEVLAQDAAHRSILEKLAPRHGIFAPMTAREGVLGVVSFLSSSEERRYGTEEVAFAEDLAHRAAVALGNARLFQQAQQATRERDDLLAVVAHDLRNPLGSILGAAAILEERSVDAAGAARFLAMIRRAAEGMNRLIQDLLDATRIGTGRLSLEHSDLSLPALVEEALLMIRPLAEARNVRLDAELAAGLGEVRADRVRVLQVLSNIIGNAVKFTPEGGLVVVRCEDAGGAIRVAVQDTGPGIPPEQLPDVFGRFWQADSADRRGVGLGLSIAKGIVEAHGGQIWVESEVGVGSTFYFTLSRVGDPPPEE
jgi:PAS domain S-box-containing protein